MLQKVQATTELDSGVPQIAADANKLKQVFTNLILNAADAMPGGGGHRHQHRTGPEARQIDIAFRDSGGGIPADIQGKIFDPFFSTKGAKGTGWAGRQLRHHPAARRHHRGPEPRGRGTTMTVRLPIDETEHKEQHDG